MKLSVETDCNVLLFMVYIVSPGDTLFVGGCGRFFEGTPEQMYHALCEVLGTLPHETVSLVISVCVWAMGCFLQCDGTLTHYNVYTLYRSCNQQRFIH